jgi:hypothetical protein
MYVHFDMHVFAYSNVGTGQICHADFERGTFLPIEPPEGMSVGVIHHQMMRTKAL